MQVFFHAIPMWIKQTVSVEMGTCMNKYIIHFDMKAITCLGSNPRNATLAKVAREVIHRFSDSPFP